jgi:lysyl-tRNA synthetase class 2
MSYPNDFERTHLTSDIVRQYGATSAQDLERLQPVVSLAGRLMRMSAFETALLGALQDQSGRIDILVSQEATGKRNHATFASWRAGDIIGVTGTLCRLAAGDLAVRAHEVERLVTALRKLPEEPGAERYLDLLTDQHARSVFAVRSGLIAAIRAYMRSTSYVEVETPMLQADPDPRAAQFKTHHNALRRDLYLRSSADLYLKRLLVGGIEKVYEINRHFLNQPSAADRLPEGTLLEIYSAYSTFFYMMVLVEQLLARSVGSAVGTNAVPWRGHALEFGKRFHTTTVTDAIRAHGGGQWTDAELRDRDFLSSRLVERGVSLCGGESWGVLQGLLFDAVAAMQLVQPTFVVDFPAEAASGARRKDETPELAQHFELYIGGLKVAEGRSEPNDPDQIAGRYDADFARAVEYGLPPAAGVTLSLDRLVMALTDSPSLHDTVVFASHGAR